MSEEKKFEIGDVVKLKSGSPIMTVQYTKNAFGSRSITCLYFDEGNKPTTVGDLDDSMLVAHSEEIPTPYTDPMM
ncbi:DUF2158 domain-containing protein [Bernardetia sp. OM2101]|uniref:DUF2158 domain-containing protein n=1 Tax=Bernardetia sp. OM2101 TaxID=3344876 RepID=UPI0035D09187